MRSSAQVRAERIMALRLWTAGAETISVADAGYDFAGAERETIYPVLEEFGMVPEKPEELGAHPAWVRSFGAERLLQEQRVQLTPLQTALPELTATVLENYTRCSFQALAFSRWRLEDGARRGCGTLA